MGIVSEAYHKGVPLLGVPGITLDFAMFYLNYIQNSHLTSHERSQWRCREVSSDELCVVCMERRRTQCLGLHPDGYVKRPMLISLRNSGMVDGIAK